jgi:hypothetical protein
MPELLPFKRPKIYDEDGKEVVLNSIEREFAMELQPMVNKALRRRTHNAANLGFEIPIDTLTTIIKKVSEKKNYKVNFADNIPTKVGEGYGGAFLTTYKAVSLGGPFSDGIISTGGDNTRLATATAGVTPITKSIYNWAKSIGWNIFELQQALMANNWDLVEAREKARRLNWELGLQEIAFLGLPELNGQSLTTSVLGLLTQPSTLVTYNTTLITKQISAMSANELTAFIAGLLPAYQTNCAYTEYPNRLGIPQSDWNGMTAPSSPDFPLQGSSKIEVLEAALKKATGRSDFKIFPIAYADAARHKQATNIADKDVYVLYNMDDSSLRFDIPCEYTATMAQSLDGFNLQNAAYGQFAGVQAIREKELMYFTLANVQS